MFNIISTNKNIDLTNNYKALDLLITIDMVTIVKNFIIIY